jgi:hypothetical protein
VRQCSGSRQVLHSRPVAVPSSRPRQRRLYGDPERSRAAKTCPHATDGPAGSMTKHIVDGLATTHGEAPVLAHSQSDVDRALRTELVCDHLSSNLNRHTLEDLYRARLPPETPGADLGRRPFPDATRGIGKRCLGVGEGGTQ